MKSFRTASIRPMLINNLSNHAKLSARRLTTRQTTQKGSGSFRCFAFTLVIGFPAGWYLNQAYKAKQPDTRPNLHDFYEGSLEWRGNAVKPYTLADANLWLRKEQSSHQGPEGSGVKSWDISRRPSNAICEDSLVTARGKVDAGKPWLFWGIFDGHAGWETSATLRESLVPYVVRGLSNLFQTFNSDGPFSHSAVDATIKSTFQQLDDEILNDGIEALKSSQSSTEILSRLAPGYAGSCALLSIYDPNTKLLRVACTGDSRAVLARRDPQSGKYIAEALSIDQTGFDEAELLRVQSAHPGEVDVINIKTGRTLGIAVTRAFGDGLWKWPLDVVKECHEKFFYRAPRPGYKTPPYLVVEPVVTTTQIREEGEFMIMASDGLWEHMSSEQAVKVVEIWITASKNGMIGKEAVKSIRPIHETRLLDEQKVDENNFVVEDENVATHLVRNSFGGGDHETLLGLVGAQAPLSRSVRDDITIQVIFFEDRA